MNNAAAPAPVDGAEPDSFVTTVGGKTGTMYAYDTRGSSEAWLTCENPAEVEQ